MCQNCGLPLAPQASFCQKCGTPISVLENIEHLDQNFFETHPISAVRRFWSMVLDILLFWLTLGFGWIIWALVLVPKAQTPAKQILGYLLVDRSSGKRPAIWRVAIRLFLPVALTIFAFFGPLYVLTYTHEAFDNLVVPVGGTLVIALFLLVDGLMVLTRQRRRLFDFIFNTTVVREFEGQI